MPLWASSLLTNAAQSKLALTQEWASADGEPLSNNDCHPQHLSRYPVRIHEGPRVTAR